MTYAFGADSAGGAGASTAGGAGASTGSGAGAGAGAAASATGAGDEETAQLPLAQPELTTVPPQEEQPELTTLVPHEEQPEHVETGVAHDEHVETGAEHVVQLGAGVEHVEQLGAGVEHVEQLGAGAEQTGAQLVWQVGAAWQVGLHFTFLYRTLQVLTFAGLQQDRRPASADGANAIIAAMARKRN